MVSMNMRSVSILVNNSIDNIRNFIDDFKWSNSEWFQFI